MAELIIAVVAVVALTAASKWADQRFNRLDRLPMQWSVRGEANWSAPRRMALAFTPALAALVLGAIVAMIALSGEPKPGQEGFGIPIVLFVSATFIAVHALHLRLIDRTMN